jgi:O-antigen/teichoic acid export membrane protein
MMRGITRGIATSYAALGSQVAFFLVITAFLIDRRGKELYGAWAIVFLITQFMRSLDYGLGTTTARFVAAAREPGELRRVVASAVVLLGGGGVVALAAGLAVAAGSDDLFGASEYGLSSAIAVATVAVALQLPLSAFGWTLFGVRRIADRNAWTVARMVLSGLAIVVAVELDTTLTAWVAAGAAAELVVVLGQTVWCLRRVDGAAPAVRDFDRERLRALARFSTASLAMTLAAQIIFYSDGVVIGVALTAADVAVYTVGMRLVDGTSQVLRQFSEVFLPVFSELDASDRRERATAIVHTGTRVTLLVGYPLLGLLVALGQPLVALWVGDGFDRSWVPLALLAGGAALNAPLRFVVFWAMGSARHGVIGALAGVEAAFNLALSIVLVGPLGIDGVALATLVSLAVFNGLVVPRVAYARMGGSMWPGFLRPVLLAACVSAPLVVLGRLVVAPGVEDSVLLTVLASLALTAALFALLAAVLFSREERASFVGALRGRLTRRRPSAPAAPTAGD